MGKLNHTCIKNTKSALKQVLKKLETSTDAYVDSLVERYPDQFSKVPDEHPEDACVSPFPLILDMVSILSEQYDSFAEQYAETLRQEKELLKDGDKPNNTIPFKKPTEH